MKTELTLEEEALMEVVKNEWIDRALNQCVKGVDKEKFESKIEWLYKRFLDLEKPTVVYCDSLIAAVLTVTLVKDFGKEPEDYTPEFLEKYKNKELEEEFYTKVKENYDLNSAYISWSNFGWTSFYDYFTRIGVIDNEDFNNYKELIEANPFECFEFEKAVFVVQPPVKVNYNEDMLPHNTEGPSVIFKDGSCFYHAIGMPIDEELYLKLQNRTYTFKEFLQESNEEVKSSIIAYIQSRDGETGVYDFLKENLKEVHTHVDKKADELMVGTTNSTNIGVYTLFKGSVEGIDIAYVRCYCPSTDRMFFLGVDPNHTDAADAIASLYQVPRILRDNIVSISRQGEKFSTTFDEETTKKLENNEFPFESLQDYVDLTGKEYFGLMKYEY